MVVMMRELEEPVERHRPIGGTPDPYNPDREGATWENFSGVARAVFPLSFAPETGRLYETPLSREAVSAPVFYGEDPRIDVLDKDRLVRYDGTTWEVEGDPARWDAVPGWPSGIVIAVRRVS